MMLPSRPPDCAAIVRLLSTEEGGRATPAASGYRPQHSVREDYATSGTQQYLDVETLHPGGSSRTHIWFAAPEIYRGCLWIGRTLRLQEGSRLVGFAEITKIFNSVLDRDATNSAD